jgi:hypothetical protein
MKGKTRKLLSLAMALVLVTSLCAAMAAPAAANITAPAVVIAPTYGAATAQYTVNFNVGAAGALTRAVDTITIRFPVRTTVPSSIAASAIMVNNVPLATAPGIMATGVATHPTQVTMVTPVAVANNGAVSVVFSTAAGIVNPSIPAAATYTVFGFTSIEPVPVASAVYAVTTTIAISPATGASGTTITVAGGGFAANSSIDLWTDNGAGGGVANNQVRDGTEAIRGSTTTDASGAFSTTLTASATVTGNICAIDGAGTASANSPAFAILSSITVTPTTGIVGTLVTIRGSNYTAFVGGETLAVTVGGVAVTGSPFATTAAATTFTLTNVPIPATTGGAKTIAVTASVSGNVARATYDAIGQVITLTPSSAPVGTTITVAGTGYQANETVNVAYPGATVQRTPLAGADGTFSTTFAVPVGSVTGAVTATGLTSAGVATATLTVPAASITISPTRGAVGTSVTLTGSALLTSRAYDIIFTDAAGIQTIVATVSSDSVGALNATVAIPAAAAGAGNIRLNPLTAAAQVFTVLPGTVTVAVTDGLSSIAGLYTKVWAFNATTQAWVLYDTAAPAVSDLASLTRGMGYWMEVSEDCIIVYGGNTYALSAGWNLIGWLG